MPPESFQPNEAFHNQLVGNGSLSVSASGSRHRGAVWRKPPHLSVSHQDFIRLVSMVVSLLKPLTLGFTFMVFLEPSPKLTM